MDWDGTRRARGGGGVLHEHGVADGAAHLADQTAESLHYHLRADGATTTRPRPRAARVRQLRHRVAVPACPTRSSSAPR